MAKYYIGTAGWSYKDWEGIVYPTKKSPNFHALVFLAQFINLMEINSTFYRPPQFNISLSWVKRVEPFPDFLFVVKLHQIYTHQRKDFSQKDIDQFKFGMEPLLANNRLAALLMQFPWSFAGSETNRDYLLSLFKSFTEYPLALEIRHNSWSQPEFFRMLSEHNVSFCNIDQPIFKNSILPSAISTNPEQAYVRLHGRNYQNWFKKDAGRDARYDYLYAETELDDWVEKIKKLGETSKKVVVVTNNHYRGQALANAIQIKNKITGEKLDLPTELVKQYPLLRAILKKIKEGQMDLFDEK